MGAPIDPRADPHESCREGAAALREQLRGADLGKANLRVKLTEATARALLLEGLLREVLEGLDALTDDSRDPAVRKLLRRIRAAVEAR